MMMNTVISRPLHTSTMLGFTLLSLAALHSRGGGGSRLGSYNGISLHYQGRQVGFPRGEEGLSQSLAERLAEVLRRREELVATASSSGSSLISITTTTAPIPTTVVAIGSSSRRLTVAELRAAEQTSYVTSSEKEQADGAKVGCIWIAPLVDQAASLSASGSY